MEVSEDHISMAFFDINDAEPSGSAAKELVSH
jgi:hypothetical protein